MNGQVDFGNGRSSTPTGRARPYEEFSIGISVESEGRDIKNYGYANRES